MESVFAGNFFVQAASRTSGDVHASHYGGRGGVPKGSLSRGQCLQAKVRWARSFGSFSRQDGIFGNVKRVVAPLHLITPVGKRGVVRAAFTEKQEALVKDTWAILKKDAGHHAMVLFMKVFEIAPSAKNLFSFLKDSDVPLDKNPQLKSHAVKVFVIICEAATSLRKKGEVSTPGTTMKDMSHSHLMSGVVDEHYEVVKLCMLKTLEEGLPADVWNEEVNSAWGAAYDELLVAMKAEEQANPVK
eukprot:c12658_g1_i1 orf=262-993(-)